MLIEKIIGKIEDYDLSQYLTDCVVLNHEELTKPHQKVISKAGREIAISLPVGETLYVNAVLYADDNMILYVDAAEEEVLEIYPKNNLEWARSAFNIGNMHHPAYIKENSIITPYDPSIERIFKTLEIKYERRIASLDGTRANVSQVQNHDHCHNHDNNTSGDNHKHKHKHSKTIQSNSATNKTHVSLGSMGELNND